MTTFLLFSQKENWRLKPARTRTICLCVSLFRSLGENDNFISLRISELKKTSHYKINTSIMLVSLQNPHVLFTFIHVNMNGKDRIACTANCSQLFPLHSQSLGHSQSFWKISQIQCSFFLQITLRPSLTFCETKIFLYEN